jgi:3-dehydroquinate synthase
VIKYGVIADPALFNLLESSMKPILNHDPKLITEIIVRSCTIKGQIVQADERDQQHRANLNWGHTFGHAIESVTQYQRFLHGEAVSIGMNCAAHVSHALGLVHHDFINRQADLLMLAELPIALPKNISINEIIDLMKSDKKSTHGKISLIVARNFGDVFKMDRVDEGVIREVLNKILKEEGESR